jgi:hypothetical protein
MDFLKEKSPLHPEGDQNPPPNLGIKTDELVKSQEWDGKVKSAKCKACESRGVRRTYPYAAMTKDEA